jgi:hypothetical protein
MLHKPLPIPEPGQPYDFAEPVRVLAVDGSRKIGDAPAIGSHGDISNRFTWWALHNLVAAQP